MPVLCCIVGCYTNISKHKDVVLYKFPDNVAERGLRKRWIEAVRIANFEKSSWEPNSTSKLCSEHFVGNCRSLNPSDPNSVPTIFPPAKSLSNVRHGVCIDVDDSETGSDDYESEVIEETSDCLFVVGKFKQEDEQEDPPKPSKNVQIRHKANGRKTWTPKAAPKRKIARGSRAKKEQISSVSKENEASSAKRSKVTSHCNEKDPSQDDCRNALFMGKFSSESSDPDFDEGEFGEFFDDEEDDVSEKEFLSVADKIKVAFKTSTRPQRGHSDIDSEDDHLSSDDALLLKKMSRKKIRKPARFSTKGCQAALPGVCDGFVFCTTRDDDFNVGIQCNIFYEFKLTLPNRNAQECAAES